MRYMMIRKADTATEQGDMPSEAMLTEMVAYNERMAAAGVFVSGDGLAPTRDGCRIQFSNGKPTVVNGPFEPARDQIAGYTILEVDSLEDAIHWASQWPPMDADGNALLELRRYFAEEDFVPGAGIDRHLKLEAQQQKRPDQFNVYLMFDGRCRQALTFYAELLGGVLEDMMTYGNSPAADEVPETMHELVIHGAVNLGGRYLMGSDMPADQYQLPASASVQISYKDPARGEAVFNALAEGGQVEMPFAETFWAYRFGMVRDRFGVQWMINCDQPGQPCIGNG